MIKNKFDLSLSAMKMKFDNLRKYLSDSVDYNEERASSIEDDLSEDFYNYLKFSDHLFTSGVIISYSIFDYFFNQYCIYVQKSNFDIQYRDIKGDNDLDKKRKFVKSVMSIDLIKQIPNEWKEINNFRKIRNIIVHHNSNVYFGNISNKNNPSKQIIESIKLLKVYESIEFDDEYGMFWIKDISFITDFMNNSLVLMKQFK